MSREGLGHRSLQGGWTASRALRERQHPQWPSVTSDAFGSRRPGALAVPRPQPVGGGSYSLSSRSGFMLKGSRRSASGSRLLSRSSSGTVWSMPIWIRRRMADISLTFWICSAYLAYLFWRSCMKLKRVSTDRSICRRERSETHSTHRKQVPSQGWGMGTRCGAHGPGGGATSFAGSGIAGHKNLPGHGLTGCCPRTLCRGTLG